MPQADISASPQVEALWSETEPVPAEQQQPLWSVELEGRRSLRVLYITLVHISALLQVEALWAETEPVPAERQQPLWSVELEGERALHYFETLPPEAAFAQLLALGLSCALHALSRSLGAAVPCARPPLDR